MSRLSYLAVVMGAIALFAFIAVFSSVTVVPNSPIILPTEASSTVAIVPSFTIPTLSVPSSTPKAPVATPTPKIIKKAKSPAPEPSPVASPSLPLVPAVTIVIPSGNASLDASASVLRSALVNIVCYVSAGSSFRSILGSGVFIDSKGIILTNAHVAQYFLLADRGAECMIRTGGPAIDSYDASLIYISPAWLRANASVLTQANPKGTGEYDFALLAVTKSVTNKALPSSFPSIPLATNPPLAGTSVVIASYGAQFLETNQIISSLFPTIVFGSVKDIFTFASTTIDVLALGGSAAAQEGSSGGGVSDSNGELIGTITTSTVEGNTSTRELNAITASYIRSEYASETSSPLDLLLNQSTAQSVAAFASQIPALEALLTAHLQ